MLTYLLAVVIDAVSPEPPPAIAPPHNYLNPPVDGCDSRKSSDEVVVCGSKDADARYRLKPIENAQYEDKPVRAETKLGAGTLGVAGGQTSVGGFPSKRVMVTLKFPF